MTQESIQSPLAKARGAGSARSGVTHWWHQRLTAVAALPLMLWLACSATQLHGASYNDFTSWLSEPINAILMILSILTIFYHAALGVQVIIEDYVHHEGHKIFKLIAVKFYFIAAAVACLFAVLKIALGHG